MHTRVPNQRDAPGTCLQPCPAQAGAERRLAGLQAGTMRPRLDALHRMALDWYAPRYSHQIQSFTTATLCFVRSFDVRIANSTLKSIWTNGGIDFIDFLNYLTNNRKNCHSFLFLVFGDIDRKRYDSPSCGWKAWWELSSSWHEELLSLSPMSWSHHMGRVGWLVVAWAKWCPIPNFSSQLAPNYHLWSIHC